MSKRDLLIAGMAVVLVIAYLWFGSYPDPAYRLSRLRGLTEGQVIARLGRPELKATYRGGPVLIYANAWWRWEEYRYSVIFKNGHVVDVKLSDK